MKAGWVPGLVNEDALLDYLQDVVTKIGDDETFMEDFAKSKGSGKIKFYKKYLEESDRFIHNNNVKIKKHAWSMFLDTYEHLQEDFKDEPDPIKEVIIDPEKLAETKRKADLKLKENILREEEIRKQEKKNKEAERSVFEAEEALKEKAKAAETERKAEERKKKKK